MRISRKLSIILVISIALNLLLGGSIASHWLFRGDSVTAGFRGPLHHTAAREKLSGGNQAKVDQIWHQRRAIHRENIHAMRDARRHVYDAIVADPFDRHHLADLLHGCRAFAFRWRQFQLCTYPGRFYLATCEFATSLLHKPSSPFSDTHQRSRPSD